MLTLVFVAAFLAPTPQTTTLVGLWDTTTTSAGGIGTTLEFRADGTYVEANTVIVNVYYRIDNGRLVISEGPRATDADMTAAARIDVDGNVFRATTPDGSVLRKERLGSPEPGKPAIVGAWRYRHYSGATAFERYSNDGRMFFRLPLKSMVGRFELKGNELSLTRPNQGNVAAKIVLAGDELSLSMDGRTLNYRRDKAGPWYDREHIVR